VQLCLAMVGVREERRGRNGLNDEVLRVARCSVLMLSICSMLYALLYALCSMLYALCSMLYALCFMLCCVLYAQCSPLLSCPRGALCPSLTMALCSRNNGISLGLCSLATALRGGSMVYAVMSVTVLTSMLGAVSVALSH
jgi:hypothetical protein